MKIRITLLFISASIHLFAEREWHNVSYFERHDADVRIHVYDPPIVLEWGNLPEDISIADREKIQAMANGAFYHHDTFESWYEHTHKYATADALKAQREIEELKKSYFNTPSIEEIKKKYPQIRFTSIIYSIDFRINRELYSYVVQTEGRQNNSEHLRSLISFPDMTGKVIAGFLKFENGQWKNHIGSQSLFHLTREFGNPPLLNSIIEAGYCYHSIAEAGLVPFDPPERLKVDSIRERYDGETLFQYPEPDAHLAELRAQEPTATPPLETPHESTQVQPSAWLIGLLVAYGLIATIGWMRK